MLQYQNVFSSKVSQELLAKHDAGHNEAPVGCRSGRKSVWSGIYQDAAEGRRPSVEAEEERSLRGSFGSLLLLAIYHC